MIQPEYPSFSSFLDFLAWEHEQPTKHEFIDGIAVDFAGGTIDHSAIAANILASIAVSLRGSPCIALGSDAAIKTSSRAGRPRSRYADIVVTCDEGDRDGRKLFVARPKLIVEVLSATTAEIDLRDKADEYRALESLEEYLLVESRTVWYRLYRRAGDRFEEVPVVNPIELTSIGVTLPLALVYEKTTHFEEPYP